MSNEALMAKIQELEVEVEELTESSELERLFSKAMRLGHLQDMAVSRGILLPSEIKTYHLD